MFKRIIKTVIPKVAVGKIKENIKLLKWFAKGKPVPPPHMYKAKTIDKYRKLSNATIFVETGTYYGEMTAIQKKKFKKVISIELCTELYEKAVEKFKFDKNVKLFCGDSGLVLPAVLKNEVNEKAVFWLDGHYSGGDTAKGEKECPIFEELDAIFSMNNYYHTIIIDDARCFVGKNDYPTIDELTRYIKTKDSNYIVENIDDIIRSYKKI